MPRQPSTTQDDKAARIQRGEEPGLVELPIPQEALHYLMHEGVYTTMQLCQMSESELVRIPALTKHDLVNVADELEVWGYALAFEVKRPRRDNTRTVFIDAYKTLVEDGHSCSRIDFHTCSCILCRIAVQLQERPA